MKILLLLLLAVPAAAQEDAPIDAKEAVAPAPPAPAAEVTEAPKALPKPSMAPEEKKEEPKAEPKPEPKAASLTESGSGTSSAMPRSPEVKKADSAAEFAFAKAAAEDSDNKVREAAAAELDVFVRRYPSDPLAPEAMLLLAGLRQASGDWQPAMASLLRLLYEYPDTKVGLRAKSDFLTLVDKKASRKHRPILADLVKLPDTSDKADRLSALWRKVAEQAPDAIYEPVAAEMREFTVRFPDHKDGDKLQAALAKLHAANDKPAAAMLSWRKLLALFPDSALRPQAQMAVGDLWADSLRDPKKAIDAYQELVEKYPKAPEVQSALERSAQLFDDKLRQYALAVEMHERVVTLFPKTPGSLKALKAIAKLQRDRLGSPGDAVKTLTRLSSMHGGQDGIDALLQAADYAKRDLKDPARQAELLRKVSDDYAGAKEAPQALYDAAEVYETALKDDKKALELYKEFGGKYPSHKLAKRADAAAAKLEAK